MTGGLRLVPGGPQPPRRIGLVANPTAGGGRAADRLTGVVDRLEGLGLEVVMRTTAAAGDGRRLAAGLRGEVDALAVLGGDGTVNEVVNGLAGAPLPLGILPGGTINVLARELGLPLEPAEACAVLAAGHRARIDLGRAAGHWFTLHAGIGLDALTVQSVHPDAKRRYRELAFVAAGLRAYLSHGQPGFRVTVDGHVHSATFAVVANCANYAGRFGLALEAHPQDGLFDVVLYQGRGFTRTAAFWLSMLGRVHLRHPDARLVRGRRVQLDPLDTRHPVWVQTDGEVVGRLPMTVELMPLALEIFVRAAPEASRLRPSGAR